MWIPKYEVELEGASYVGQPKENTFMFITKKVEHLLQNLNAASNCLVFAQTGMNIPEEINAKHKIVLSEQPQQEYAMLADFFAKERMAQEKTQKYTLTSEGYYVAPSAVIGENAYIEPNCVIGHDVVIGKNAVILSGAVLKHCTIGDDVLINEYAVVGANGFTMAEDDSGNKIRIPTLGRVVVGNNVEIGAFDNISCGSGGDTLLDDYVKVDAHTHIGHDVHLHTNVEITADAIIGGFVKAKDHAYVGINAVVRNRVDLGEGAFVGMGAVVTKSVPDHVTVVGNPAKAFERR